MKTADYYWNGEDITLDRLLRSIKERPTPMIKSGKSEPNSKRPARDSSNPSRSKNES